MASTMRAVGNFFSLSAWRTWRLPAGARDQVTLDRAGLPAAVPSIETSIEACIAWLSVAQDRSKSVDGGVARVYSLLDGWSTSYPETTGYIIPTFLALAARRNRPEWRARAHRMLEWLKSIQLPEGGFQGGMIDSTPVVPVVFNTGQILLGLAAGEAEFGGYGDTLRAAADWLVRNQDEDGGWRRGASPFARNGDKTYDTHTGWGLLEAARVTGERSYAQAAFANAHWTIAHQKANGWLDHCCLTDPREPLTHTLGYALRGLLEANRYEANASILQSAVKLANGLLGAMDAEGFLPGKLRQDWSPAVRWACLTGTAQVAHSWLMLYQLLGDARYLDAARRATRYVRRTLVLTGPAEFVGAVRGSFPVDGAYCRYQYPNWAAKFLVDALVLEQEVGGSGPG